MKRKAVVLILCAMMIMCAGCGNETTDNSSALESESISAEIETTESVADKGFRILSGGLNVPSYNIDEFADMEGLGASDLITNGASVR